MKKYTIRLGLAFFATLLLAACGPSQADKDKAAADAAQASKLAAEQAALVLPKDVNDKSAWQNYFKACLTKFQRENASTVKANRLYTYYLPGGDGADQQTDRAAQLDNLKTAVSRGGVAGNLIAFVGPVSKLTADLIVEGFKDVSAGSFKGVFLVFVGSPDDQDRVKAAVEKSGADFRFVEMK